MNEYKLDDSQLRRFWAKVDIKLNDECWNWVAGKDSFGYGMFWIASGMHRAHRISWYLHNNKPIPLNLAILHSCDNPTCVNPNHLSLDSNAKNIVDAVARGLHSAPNRALTQEQANIIRELYKNDILNMPQLAVRFNVGKATIHRIIRNVMYKEE